MSNTSPPNGFGPGAEGTQNPLLRGQTTASARSSFHPNNIAIPGITSPTRAMAIGPGTPCHDVAHHVGSWMQYPPFAPDGKTTRPLHVHEDDDMDEAVLSEGQFDDLYEPQRPEPPKEALEEASNADADSAEFYHVHDQERDPSYSPFLAQEVAPTSAPSPTGNSQTGARIPGLASRDAPPSSASHMPDAAHAAPPLPAAKRLPEARKEAQRAILALITHGIKFQDYVSEGFDEKLMQRYFTDLNLDMPAPAPAGITKMPDSASSAMATTAPNPPEERKDKIRRLLEAKVKAKAEKAESEAAAAKAAQTDKNRLLQERLAALHAQRMREAQQKEQADKVIAAVKPRKRAVASDSFGDGEPVQPKKRSLAKPAETSVIITVSDDDDDHADDIDDDDGPMDMDEPAMSPNNKRVADVPPLAPSTAPLPWANKEASSQSSNTPPSGTRGKSTAELVAISQRIEETKRKIAEMEARNKAKKTLVAAPLAPSAPSPGLLILPGAASEPRRRHRILGHEVMARIDEDLSAKEAMLREMEDNRAKLVAQIAQKRADKAHLQRQLASEAAALDRASSSTAAMASEAAAATTTKTTTTALANRAERDADPSDGSPTTQPPQTIAATDADDAASTSSWEDVMMNGDEDGDEDVTDAGQLPSQPLPAPTKLKARQPFEYESVLSMLKSYRFHKDYATTVPGGWTSLTYSNRINPQSTLCPHELLGNACPPDCSLQHWAQMPMDENVLCRDFLHICSQRRRDEPDARRYTQEYKALLSEIKRCPEAVNVSWIVQRIVAFRWAFDGDKTSWVLLGYDLADAATAPPPPTTTIADDGSAPHE